MLKFMYKIIAFIISSLLNLNKSLLSMSNYYSRYGIIRLIMFYFNKITLKTLIKIFNYFKVFMLIFNTLFGVLVILSINDISFAYWISNIKLNWTFNDYVTYISVYMIDIKDKILRSIITMLNKWISNPTDAVIETDCEENYKIKNLNPLINDGVLPDDLNEPINKSWWSDHPDFKFHLINACLISVSLLGIWGMQICAEELGYDYFYQPFMDRNYYYSLLELIRGSEYWHITHDIVAVTPEVVPDVVVVRPEIVIPEVGSSLETLSDSGSITPTNVTRVTTPPIDDYDRYFK